MIRLRITHQSPYSSECTVSFVEDVDEYVCGYKYIHIHTHSGHSFVYARSTLLLLERIYTNGKIKPVRLKKIPESLKSA